MRSAWLRSPRWALLLLCALVLALNANALDAFFVGDDFEILFEALKARTVLEATRTTFMENWGPLSYLQFYLNYRLGGGFNPLVYHLTNLAWLTLLVFGLWSLVRTIWPEEVWAAWAAALLFLTHPTNDQAVANIAGRSHIIAVAMAVVAFALYAKMRLGSANGARSAPLFAAALAAAFLAGLSKESAMTLPAWIVAFEWAIVRPRRGHGWGRALRDATISASLFALAAASVFVARRIAVPGMTPKVYGVSTNDEAFLLSDFSVYALLSGLPFPFAWADLPVLERFWWLGWLAVAAVLAIGIACFVIVTFRPARASTAQGLWLVGITIAVTTLLPVAYADLQMQRRYVFITNVGTVLMAVVALEVLRKRWQRVGTALLAAMLVAGAIGTVQRNDLYRRAGLVSKNVLEATFHRPISELPIRGDERPRVSYITMPRHYGGDRASGAILMHHTDLRAALWLMSGARSDLNITLRCHHAEDYSATAVFETDTSIDLTVTFRTLEAYRTAWTRDPDDDRLRDYASSVLVSTDPASRTLHYRVTLSPTFWDEGRELFMYSDDRFVELRPPGRSR